MEGGSFLGVPRAWAEGSTGSLEAEDVSGAGFIDRYFVDRMALTRALGEAMTDLIHVEAITGLLGPDVHNAVIAEVTTSPIRAADRIVLILADPLRLEFRRQVLAFVRGRRWLHHCLCSHTATPQSKVERTREQGPPPPLESSEAYARRQFLRTELDPVEQRLHSDVLKGCLRHTRVRVLQDITQALQTALQGSGGLVWLKGALGVGKTAVMSTLAQQLRQSDTVCRLGTFYASRNDAGRKDPRRIFPTLAYDLSVAHPEISLALAKSLRNRSVPTAPNDQLRVLLLDPLRSHPSPTVIIIDGLDECVSGDGLDQILEALTNRVETTEGFAIVVSSRSETSISRFLRERSIVIDLDDSTYQQYSRPDVDAYFCDKLPDSILRPLLAKVDPPLAYENAISKLSAFADGYFLFASFTCSVLLGQTDHGKANFLSRILDQGEIVPRASNSLYDQFFLALDTAFGDAAWSEADIRVAAKDVLAILACAQEPIASSSIARLGGINEEIAGDALKALSPLLLGTGGGRFTFFHASVVGFLTSANAGEYRVDCASRHSCLAQSCLELLERQLDFNMWDIDDDYSGLDRTRMLDISKELRYASLFWTHHLVASSMSTADSQEKVFSFLAGKLLFWLEVLCMLRSVNANGISGLDRVATFLKDESDGFLTDCRKCLVLWASNISKHPLRLYLAVLPWLPPRFRDQLEACLPWLGPVSVRILVGSTDNWPNGVSGWYTDSRMQSVAYSPDGSVIASGMDDGTLRLWRAQTGEPYTEPLCAHADVVVSVAFSPDGSRLASGSDDSTVRIWDVESGLPIFEPLAGHTDAVCSVAFSPDGSIVASASDDGTIRLWDIMTGESRGHPLRGHTDWVTSVAFSSDGALLASGSDDMTIRLWDARSGAPHGEPLLGHTDWVNSVAFSPDGRTIVSGSDDATIRFWDARNGSAIGEPLMGHIDPVSTVAFSLDGTTAVSASHDYSVRLWNLTSYPTTSRILHGHCDSVNSVAFSSDGSTIVSGSDDKTIRLWDVTAGAPRGDALKGNSDPITFAVFSPDGTTVASSSDDETFRLWDVRTGGLRGEPLHGHTDIVCSIAFNADGLTAASGSYDTKIRLWDISIGAPRGGPLEGHGGAVTALVFSADGLTVASGSFDGTVRLWDATAGTPQGRPLQGYHDSVISVAFSPDSSRLASGFEDGSIGVWDVRAGALCGEALHGHSDWVNAIVFSPSGALIASASNDMAVRIWDASTTQALSEILQGHTSWIRSVAFSDDSTTLFSVSGTEILRWDLGEPLLSSTESSTAPRALHIPTARDVFPFLPFGYTVLAFSPATRCLAGDFGRDENRLFVLSLPSDNPWKTMREAHDEYRRSA